MVKATTSSVSDHSPSFEQAMSDLEGIVRRLETGQADLESTILDYERGMKLKQYCEEKLASARLKVESIFKQADGSLSTKAFDSEQ
jgi:exodeoxyribonuclease VII small subunit